jgi:hypothetical protein
MAKPEVKQLLTKDSMCSECGQKLNRAMAYEGAPSNTKGELLWCSNPDCQNFGLMLDAQPPTESETSRQA